MPAQASYGGDRALDRLLAEAGKTAGVRVTAARAVRDVLRGVLGAPPGRKPDDWMALVAAHPPGALKAQLRALKTQMELSTAEDMPKAERLAALRARLKAMGVDGFIVPRADAHQGEYVPASEKRLGWLTGFTGSAGIAVVLAESAALFVDGRYTLQARGEVDTASFSIQHVSRLPPSRWVAANIARGAVLGYDPWLMTPRDVARFAAACKQAGARLKALARNPVDAVWPARPAPPLAPIRPLATRFAGESAADKRRRIAAGLAADGIDAAVLTGPDSIAWLLNIRGGDVAHSPLPLSFALIRKDGRVDLFTDPRKILPETAEHLGPAVSVRPVTELGPALDVLGERNACVLADPAGAPDWVFRRLARAGAEIREGDDPCQMPKACKNRVELSGIRAAHRRDGAALTRFIAWLAVEAPKGKLTESAAADVLEAMRSEGRFFQGLSFPTISGAGPHGAIVHYRVTAETNRQLRPGEMYLLDSGAQYLDGTTDVTRTLFIGGGRPPTAAMKDHFTRVLKGHIQLAMVRFPEGTSGSQLDVLARRALWQAGLEYDHGTGHGVGHFLSVHEGPQRISQIPNSVALRPGMVVSNEPGYYKAGAYGIRIENLVAVRADGKGVGGRQMYAFETLTLAPIERRLIEPRLLTAEEKTWLDAYHQQVATVIGPQLDTKTRAWLKKATAPV
ncbi:MAG: aminopeptidase P family protein [Alphaproteobacteria bacterium]